MRELENLIKRMVILGTDAQIRREVADAIAGRALRMSPIPALQPLQPRTRPPPVAARGCAPAPAGVRPAAAAVRRDR